MSFEIEPTSRYALKARDSAEAVGLDFKVFSYSRILESVPEGGDFIAKCAEVTGTAFDEQLKFALVSDIKFEEGTYGRAAVGVVRYGSRLDFRKLGQLLVDRKVYPQLKPSKLSARKTDPRLMGVEPGYLGINEKATYPVTVIDVNMADRNTRAKIPYVFDNAIKDAPKICFPTGCGKADELVVVSADSALGERLDAFLAGILGRENSQGIGSFLFGDIGKQ